MSQHNYFLCTVNFFHSTRDEFDRQEFANFVADVEWRVENDVPANGSDEQLRWILKWTENRFAEQGRCHHSSGKNDQHCTQPASQRMFSREGMRSRTQILLYRQSRQQRVCDIKVGEHFQFYDLIGDVKKALRIHLFVVSRCCWFTCSKKNPYTGGICGKSKNRIS